MHTEIETANTFSLTQIIDTRTTSHNTFPLLPAIWLGSNTFCWLSISDMDLHGQLHMHTEIETANTFSLTQIIDTRTTSHNTFPLPPAIWLGSNFFCWLSISDMDLHGQLHMHTEIETANTFSLTQIIDTRTTSHNTFPLPPAIWLGSNFFCWLSISDMDLQGQLHMHTEIETANKTLSHSVRLLTPGQPVPTLSLYCQPSGWVAILFVG